mmetsp:Transcript_62796/g.146186  ORF Transcript_62796/g.146186 Transcript_62796/m.146186 type:complete len:192 (-) Transcript_62796:75-650(-)
MMGGMGEEQVYKVTLLDEAAAGAAEEAKESPVEIEQKPAEETAAPVEEASTIKVGGPQQEKADRKLEERTENEGAEQQRRQDDNGKGAEKEKVKKETIGGVAAKEAEEENEREKDSREMKSSPSKAEKHKAARLRKKEQKLQAAPEKNANVPGKTSKALQEQAKDQMKWKVMGVVGAALLAVAAVAWQMAS